MGNGNSTADRVKQIVDSVRMRVGSSVVSNTGVTAKVFTVGSSEKDAADPEERVQIVYHSYEKNPSQKMFAVREATKRYKDIIDKVKEEYEISFHEEVNLKSETPIQDFSDMIGAQYTANARGGFIVNADVMASSYLLRLSQTFKATSPSDKE
jgi:hypothetical protein